MHFDYTGRRVTHIRPPFPFKKQAIKIAGSQCIQRVVQGLFSASSLRCCLLNGPFFQQSL